MSYRCDRVSRAGVGALIALSLVGSAACSSSGDNDAATEITDTVVGSATPSLLAPVDFAAYIAQNPDAPVVNVHVPYEGHIESTDAFVSFETIASWGDLPDDLDGPIVLYCRSGNMSREAAATLNALGYTNIVDLEGGMNAWTAAGFQLLDDPAASID